MKIADRYMHQGMFIDFDIMNGDDQFKDSQIERCIENTIRIVKLNCKRCLNRILHSVMFFNPI